MVPETGRPPQIRNTKHSSTIVGEPEYICDVVSSTSFSIRKFVLNPGVSQTFPWLAPQAVGYEQYKPKGIIFEYRPTCGDAISSTNNAMGSVIMGTEYNVNLPDFPDKQTMVDHEYSTDLKPDECGIHPIECLRSRTVLDDLYIRNGTESVPDLKFYDLGNFYIATIGQQTAGVTIGELWVSYEFEFLKPTLASRTTNIPAQHWYWDSSLGAAPSNAGGLTLSNLREVNTSVHTAPSSAKISLPVGSYVCVHQMTITSGTITTGGANSFTNNIDLPFLQTDPATGISPVASLGGTIATGQTFIAVFGFRLTNAGSIDNVRAITAGTLSSWDLMICPVGQGIKATRRAVDWDPMAIMKNRLDELTYIVARQSALLNFRTSLPQDTPPCSPCSEEEDEKYVQPSPPSVAATQFRLRPPAPPSEIELTRSQTNIANLLLDRLGTIVAPRAAQHMV